MSSKAYGRTWRWEPLVPTAKVVVSLLGVSGAIRLVQVFRVAATLPRVAGFTVPSDRLTPQFRDQLGTGGPLGSITSLVALVTWVVWLIWQHKAQADLYARGVPGLRYTPGWAVGWWFVPFANFVMPYLTMRELWDHSRTQENSPSQSPPDWTLLAWWLAYIGGAFVGLIGIVSVFSATFHLIAERARAAGSSRVTSITVSASSIHAARLGSMVANTLGAVAAGLAIWVVLTISRREDAVGLAVPPPAQALVGWLPPRPDL